MQRTKLCEDGLVYVEERWTYELDGTVEEIINKLKEKRQIYKGLRFEYDRYGYWCGCWGDCGCQEGGIIAKYKREKYSFEKFGSDGRSI